MPRRGGFTEAGRKVSLFGVPGMGTDRLTPIGLLLGDENGDQTELVLAWHLECANCD